MSEIVFLVEAAPEGGFIARALGYSIYTEADTWDELKQEIHDAVACHFEKEQQPHIVRLHFSREEVMTV
jgi:Zn ribbon nucleic-acid-binding protein